DDGDRQGGRGRDPRALPPPRRRHAGLRGGRPPRRRQHGRRDRSDRRLAEREARHPVLLRLDRGRERRAHGRRALRLCLRLREQRGVDRAHRRDSDGERRAARHAAEGPDRDPLLRGDAHVAHRPRRAEGRRARVPAAHHGLARALALPSRRRPRRRGVLAEGRAVGRHRRGTAARARSRASDRALRRSAPVRRGRARSRGTFTCRCSGKRRAVSSGGERPVRVGCSGWNYASWKDEFYGGKPARLWLEHYARSFDTVEVNSTFYRLPRRDAVANWERVAPPGFIFTIKASRYLTHIKRLADLGPGLERFYERIAPLLASPKMGPLLWQ